jgi:hypothetical protein
MPAADDCYLVSFVSAMLAKNSAEGRCSSALVRMSLYEKENLDEKTNAENRYTLAIPVDGHPMG